MNGGFLEYGTAKAWTSSDGNDMGSGKGVQAGVERRLEWIEEDISVLHRRLRTEPQESSTGAAGDQGLRALVARLDGELVAERRAREAVEMRVATLEEALRQERKDRDVQLRGFSSGLETTMRELIERIDESISAGAAAMREKTDATEIRLRSLIQRVDEGLSLGAAALQDTLSNAGPLFPTEGSDCGHDLMCSPCETQRAISPSRTQRRSPSPIRKLRESGNLTYIRGRSTLNSVEHLPALDQSCLSSSSLPQQVVQFRPVQSPHTQPAHSIVTPSPPYQVTLHAPVSCHKGVEGNSIQPVSGVYQASGTATPVGVPGIMRRM